MSRSCTSALFSTVPCLGDCEIKEKFDTPSTVPIDALHVSRLCFALQLHPCTYNRVRQINTLSDVQIAFIFSIEPPACSTDSTEPFRSDCSLATSPNMTQLLPVGRLSDDNARPFTFIDDLVAIQIRAPNTAVPTYGRYHR